MPGDAYGHARLPDRLESGIEVDAIRIAGP